MSATSVSTGAAGADDGGDDTPSARMEAWLEDAFIAYSEQREEYEHLSVEEFADRCVDTMPPPGEVDVARAALIARLGSMSELFHSCASGPGEIKEGTDLGDFEILEPLGHGGMGAVFRARQRSVPRMVAIKIPLLGGLIDPADRRRFQRETNALGRLRHPGLVPLFHSGTYHGIPFYAMELIEGAPLSRILDDLRDRRDPARLGRPDLSFPDAVVTVALQILSALEATHREGVLHRDLKPANIMVEPDGRVRVLDFGLARLRGAESSESVGGLVGTLDYIAPEVLDDPRQASPWSDLYSVGVLLYEVLAGDRPFARGPTAVIAERIRVGDAPPLRGRGIDPRLSAVVEKAMHRDLRRRYVTAADFIADLQRYLDGREVSARPSSVLSRLARKARRHVALTATAAALALLALLLVVVGVKAHRDARILARNDALSQVRLGLLDEFADMRVNNAPVPNVGRELALATLAHADRTFPGLREARVLQAVMLCELDREAECRAILADLPHDEVTRWIRQTLNVDRDYVVPAGDDWTPPDDADPTTVYVAGRGLVWRHYAQHAIEVLSRIPPGSPYEVAAAYLIGLCNELAPIGDPQRASRQFAIANHLSGGHAVTETGLARSRLKEWELFDGRGRELRRQVESVVAASGEEGQQRRVDEALNKLLAPYQGLLGEAEEAARRAIAFDPSVPGAWSVLLRIRRLRGATREELRQLSEDAYFSCPHNPEVLGNHAQTTLDIIGEYFASGFPIPPVFVEEAHDLLRRALQMDPGDVPNTTRLAFLMYYLGRDEEALRLAEEVLTSGLRNEFVAKARELRDALAR